MGLKQGLEPSPTLKLQGLPWALPAMVPTFLPLSMQSSRMSSVSSDSFCSSLPRALQVSTVRLCGQVQPALWQLVQLLQDSLLGSGSTLLAQPAVSAPELLHVRGVQEGLPSNS